MRQVAVATWVITIYNSICESFNSIHHFMCSSFQIYWCWQHWQNANRKQNMFCDILKMAHAVQSIYCLLCFGNVLCPTTCCSCLCFWQDITETDAQCQCELQPRPWTSSSALCLCLCMWATMQYNNGFACFYSEQGTSDISEACFPTANWIDLSMTSESCVSGFLFPESDHAQEKIK